MSGKLLSCLCISVPARWGLLQRAILDFNRQGYIERELIITVKDDNYAAQIESFVDTLDGVKDGKVTGPATIKVFARPQSHDVVNLLLHTLGQARGDFITLWPDDNQNAPRRLTVQMERQLAAPTAVTVLTDCFYHFFDTRELFWTRFENPTASASERCVASSFICPRDLLPPLTPFLREHPSSKLVDAMAGTQYRRKVIYMHSQGMYLCGVRGDNMRGYDKHRVLATGLPMSYATAALVTKKDAVTVLLDDLVFDDDTIKVCGHDHGCAFEYTPKNRYPDYLFPVGQPVGITMIDDRKGVQ